MTVGLATGAFVAAKGQSIALSSLFSVTPGASNPQFLVVSGLDRNEYTASATGSTGTFSGNGQTTGFSSVGGDGLGAGIVFTYDATSGQYINATYGNLASVTLTASQDTNRNEAISLFATNSVTNLTQYANNSFALQQFTTYVGTVSVVTQPNSAPAPSQATPGSITSAAMSFVGQAWNTEGCWVLASDITAKAGASLPLTSTSVGVAGVANGEWFVAYNGPAGQAGNWQAMVQAGDVIDFATSSTTGHITTAVSGVGASAMLVDNITYVNSTGAIANSANDGSANDILVSSPHMASQEFSQAVTGSVVIYRLDTPVVAAATAAVSLGGSLALSSFVSAADPEGHAITQYQVYDSANDTFLVNGVAQTAHSAASAITTSASALATTALQAAATTGVDTLEVRAFNGTYWGDWQGLTVNVAGSATPAVAPVTPAPVGAAAVSLTDQTITQTWMKRTYVSVSLPANTFTDSQNLTLTYHATQTNGKALPSWLKFNTQTDTFSGTVPASNATIGVRVTAVDAAGAAASEAFSITPVTRAAAFRASKLEATAHAASSSAASVFADAAGLTTTAHAKIATSAVSTAAHHGATMASTAAHFAQAVSSVHTNDGVAPMLNASTVETHARHALASPAA